MTNPIFHLIADAPKPVGPYSQAQVVRLRFGLDEEPLTQSAIAKRVGASRATVRSLEERALARLATDRRLIELRLAA